MQSEPDTDLKNFLSPGTINPVIFPEEKEASKTRPNFFPSATLITSFSLNSQKVNSFMSYTMR